MNTIVPPEEMNGMNMRSRRFAVIGSGASGCYAVEALLRGDPELRVDVIERLPTPFGLIRYGVAPDHQGTKAVIRTLGRILEQERVTFYGGVYAGRDISLSEIRTRYDAVILATGVNRDRQLQLPGETLAGVVGSGALASWYNDHPFATDFSGLVAGAKRVLIIGAGNVAIDVARMFLKGANGFDGSDISPSVLEAFCSQSERRIVIVARRGPQHAKFSLSELRELMRQAPGRVFLNPRTRAAFFQGGSKTSAFPVGAALPEILALPDTPSDAFEYLGKHSVEFRFDTHPTEFLPHSSNDHLLGAALFSTTNIGSTSSNCERLDIDLTVTCIGYEHAIRRDVDIFAGELANKDGRISERLYVVGWAKRGPSGAIGTNRTDSHQVADFALEETIPIAGLNSESIGIRPLLEKAGIRWTDYQGWKRIDSKEIRIAASNRARLKISSYSELISTATNATGQLGI